MSHIYLCGDEVSRASERQRGWKQRETWCLISWMQLCVFRIQSCELKKIAMEGGMKGQKSKEIFLSVTCTCHSNTFHCLLLGSMATSSILRHAWSLWCHTPQEAYGVITGHRFANMRATLGLTPGLLNNKAHSELETWERETGSVAWCVCEVECKAW